MYDGGGCAGCPVRPCETLTYRGSACMAQRAKLGLGDPWTQGDRIRAMSDEELVEMLYNGVDAEYCRNAPECGEMLDADDGIPEEKCKGCLLNWLRQPVKEE